jgi:hypothetical protein
MRISATELESYRYYLDSDMDSRSFLERLRGFESTDKMQAGSAFHHLLEHSTGELEDAVVYGWPDGDRLKFDLYPTLLPDEQEFSFHIKLDGEIDLPVLKEAKVERTLTVDDMEVTLVAMSDGVSGRRVVDYKLSDGFDVERYESSLQWRTYLSLFDADEFEYAVFTAKEKKGVWVVSALDRFRCYRYPGMDEEVEQWVADFARFLKRHLPERVQGEGRKITF